MRAAVKRSVSGPGAVFEEFGGEEMFTDSSKDSGNSSIFMIAVDVNSRFVVLTFRERKIQSKVHSVRIIPIIVTNYSNFEWHFVLHGDIQFSDNTL